MQMRARAVSRGVAGKPTTTNATPRSQHSREVAAIFPGLNSISGCIPPHHCYHTAPLVSLHLRVAFMHTGKFPLDLRWEDQQKAAAAVALPGLHTDAMLRAKNTCHGTLSFRKQHPAWRASCFCAAAMLSLQAAYSTGAAFPLTMTGESQSPRTLQPMSCRR